jgi:hypothetical protein
MGVGLLNLAIQLGIDDRSACGTLPVLSVASGRLDSDLGVPYRAEFHGRHWGGELRPHLF